MLDAVFYMRSVSYQWKVGDYFVFLKNLFFMYISCQNLLDICWMDG
jgi:hypothetical protein